MPHTMAHISRRAYQNRQRSCKAAQAATSGRQTRAQSHTPTAAQREHRGPGTAAPTSARPSRTTTAAAAAKAVEHAPLQLPVVLERGEGELSLRTRNGANHAQHDSTHDLGGRLGRDLNGAAALVIESTRQRRLTHHEQHAVMHGAHLVQEVVQTLRYILWTRVQRDALCQHCINWPSGSAGYWWRRIRGGAAENGSAGSGGGLRAPQSTELSTVLVGPEAERTCLR